MPTAGQNWLIEVFHGRAGHERFGDKMDVSLPPSSDHVEIAMAVCVLIGHALNDMQIKKAEIDDSFEVIISLERSR